MMTSNYTEQLILFSFLPSLVAKNIEIEEAYLEKRKNELTHFFQGLIPLCNELESFQREHASEFNVFNLLRYGNYETRLHTPFLFSLLSPNGPHQLNFRFVEIVLRDLLRMEIRSTEIKRYRIIEEHAIGEDGRIDLFLTFQYENKKYCIAIENKINAEDQPNQLERYYKYMSKHFGDSVKLLVYLTKSGKYPSDYSLNNELLNQYLEEDVLYFRSYKSHVINWIDQLLTNSAPKVVKHTLNQYKQTINAFQHD